MYRVSRLFCKIVLAVAVVSGVRNLPSSVGGRSLVAVVGRWFHRLVVWSFGRWFVRSIVRSFDCSTVRLFDCSFGRSVAGNFD